MSTVRIGRPRDTNRRIKTLEVTRALLVDNGYDELTLSEVAREAGVSRPFVYENWGSKYALVEDAIFSAAELRFAIDDVKPFEGAFMQLIKDMVSVQSDPAYLAGLAGLSAEMSNRPDLIDQTEKKYLAPVRSACVALVERGKAEGVVRPGVDGSALLDSLRGAVMTHTLVNPTLDQHALVDHLCQLFIHGITRER